MKPSDQPDPVLSPSDQAPEKPRWHELKAFEFKPPKSMRTVGAVHIWTQRSERKPKRPADFLVCQGRPLPQRTVCLGCLDRASITC